MVIHVPANSVDKYKAANPWKNYVIAALAEDNESTADIGDNRIIDYDGYSLKYVVTSLEPAECVVYCTAKPTKSITIAIPSTATISGKEFTVTTIGQDAFKSCSMLTGVIIPNTVTMLKGNPFKDCYNLGSIAVEEGNMVYDSREGCNAIINTTTNTLVAGCKNTNVPNTVSQIGDYAFYGADYLRSIEIPSGVTSIGSYAFYSCEYLKSVTISNTVVSIGSYAFRYSDYLTEVIFEENSQLKTIGSEAFYDCDGLTNIEIPSSVTLIGEYAFYSCSNLTSVYCYAENVPSTGGSAFSDVPSHMVIHVPANSVDKYKAANPWKNYVIAALATNNINVTVNPANSGYIIGAGACYKNKKATLTANSNPGYKFVNWTEYGNVVSTDSEYSFNVTEDRTLMANYEILFTHWTADDSSFANNMSLIGLVQIDGVNQNSTSLEIGAFCGEEVRGSNLIQYIPALDKYLVFLTIHGDNENDEISFRLYNHETEEELDLRSPEAITFTVNGTLGSITSPYVLNFSNMVNVTASVNPEIAGSISGAGEYAINDIVTLTATANEGYQFINWTEEGTIVSEETEYSFTVMESRELVANFELLTYNVTASANPAEGGSISGAGVYTHGETATLSATSNEGYQFINWTEEGTVVSEESEYSFTVAEARELVANFELLTYNVTANANPAEGGSISGSRVYTHGETATLSATSNEGYQFINWTEEGTVVSEEAEYSFTVTESRELVANFNCVQSRNLKSGWSWFSSYIEISGAEGLEMIEEALGENGLQIKNQTAFVSNSSSGWYGSLTSVSVESMYMIETSAAHELTLIGNIVNPESHPITIGNNWKWISYLLSENIDVEEALSTINPSHGDYIKSKNAFSQYYDGIGWVGALNTMTPGEGYMYQNTSGTTKTLVYPTSASKGTRANVTSENNHWMADAGKYANNMSLIAYVKDNLETEYEIGAFVGEELRGSARPIYIEALDRYMIFMTIYGEANEEITFKYYDVNNAEEEIVFTKENVIFSTNAVLGSVDNPIAMMFDTEGIGENLSDGINIYPNPANVNSEINLGMTCDRVEIYNTLGVKIAEYSNVNKIDGMETAGVYMIRVMNDNGMRNYRVVVE